MSLTIWALLNVRAFYPRHCQGRRSLGNCSKRYFLFWFDDHGISIVLFAFNFFEALFWFLGRAGTRVKQLSRRLSVEQVQGWHLKFCTLGTSLVLSWSQLCPWGFAYNVLFLIYKACHFLSSSPTSLPATPLVIHNIWYNVLIFLHNCGPGVRPPACFPTPCQPSVNVSGSLGFSLCSHITFSCGRQTCRDFLSGWV